MKSPNPFLAVGDHLELSGGYNFESAWLGGKRLIRATVSRFMPGQNVQPATVVKLSEPLTAKHVTGSSAVLELRYVGANWSDSGFVHVELCDFEPEAKRWQERRQGAWVESHASYKRVPRF